ncbi:MAG: phosphatase PAP2 family protein [Vicingaceae bacterium]
MAATSNFIKENNIYFLGFLMVWLPSLVIALLLDKVDVHLTIINYHHPFFDTLFIYITQIAETWGILIFMVLSFLTKIKHGIIYLLSLGVASGTTFLLKQTLFEDHLRPFEFLKDTTFHAVPGVDFHSYYSFPSGHTTAAFAMFTAMALCTKNKLLKLLYLFLAFITGYSRIYLSQHFLQDVVAGALIGLMAAVVVFKIFNRKAFNKANWLNYSILCKQ